MTPKKWRALCEPETLPVSSLTQTPPRAENPSAAESSALRANGVSEAVPSTRTRASSERTSRRARRRTAPEVGGVEQVRKRTYGFSSSSSAETRPAGRARGAARGRRRRRAGVRAAERIGLARRRRCPATSADEPALAGRSDAQHARPGVELLDQLVPLGSGRLPAQNAGCGGPRTPRSARPAARPR